MSAIIDSLRQDHRNFESLLQVLQQEVAIFERAERPDYEVLEALVGYFQGYPDSCHHPKEDAVFEKLKQRDPAAAESVGGLEKEHAELADRLRNFASVVQKVLDEHTLPRETFIEAARGFIEHEREHMRKEEETFFSAAEKALQDEDWADLDMKLSYETDPLFAQQPAQELAALRERIVEWELVDQA